MVGFLIRGTRIYLDFSFFAVVGMFFAFDSGGYGWLSLAACICHELGHLAVMIIEGKAPYEMVFSGGGICIKSRGQVSVRVLSAGCAVNFFLFIFFCLVLEQNSIYRAIFGGANLFVGILNLLPVGELDGKKLAEFVLAGIFPFNTAQRILSVLEAVFCVLWIGAVFVLVFMDMINLTSVFVMIYIFALDFLFRSR